MPPLVQVSLRHWWREWSHEGLIGEPMGFRQWWIGIPKITINNNNKKFPEREERKEIERVSWERISEEEERRSESLRQNKSLIFRLWVSVELSFNLGLVLLTRVKLMSKCWCGAESKKWLRDTFLFGWQEPEGTTSMVLLNEPIISRNTGWGDSSVQITSCDTCLAYLAKRWVTVLALLLGNCTCDQLNPLGRQSTSCIIWPTRDDRLFLSSKADMTDKLSPSTTISLKPHSNANSTTRLHARVSASSLQDTGGPLLESAAS